MFNCFISFIIPIYNGEKYLNKCIDSIYRCIDDKTKFEVLCINDFSNDGSLNILEEYVRLYQNFRVINNERNLKTGTTCNIGLNSANGKYIWFIGQDDYIIINDIKKIFDIIEKNNLDLLLFNYNKVAENEDIIDNSKVFSQSLLMDGRTFLDSFFRDTICCYLLGYEWRGIFSKKYLLDNNIGLKDGVVYEDTIFLLKAIYYSNRTMSIEDSLYNYRVNNNSITSSKNKYKGELVFESSFIVAEEVLDFSNEIVSDDYIVKQLINQTKFYYYSCFPKVLCSSIKEKRVFYKQINTNKELIKKRTKDFPFIYKLLINKKIGFFFSVILAPIYLFKKKYF